MKEDTPISHSLTSRSLALLLVGILGLPMSATQAYADIVIDNFTGTNIGVSYNAAWSGTTPTSFTTGANSGSPSDAPLAPPT